MSMKMMNAAYLVDNVALLSLQEKQDGVEFHCFDMDSKVQIAEGHIGWDVLDKQPFSTLEESARVAALKEIPQLDGLTVAPVAPEMLEQVRGGRKVLWQMKKADPELENAKNIRLSPAATRIGSKFRMAVQWRSSIRTGSSQLAANIWTNIICAWGMMFCTSVSWQKCWNAAVVHAARSR